MHMPTIAQKMAFNNILEQMAKGKRPCVSTALRSAGYAPSTVRKQRDITQSKGWKELLASIDDGVLMDRVREIALEKADKRASLQAIDMLMKLKDRYPAGKLKVTEFDQEISKLEE